MRILMVHNAYQQKGGEDSVVEAELSLLTNYGHAVELYSRHNDELGSSGTFGAAREAVWSTRTARELDELVSSFKPDLIHAHNTFPLISPSVYWRANRWGIPVVQTLHNFRLLCPQAMFLRDGKICEDCLGQLPWRGVMRRCYRGSLSQSGVLSTMLAAHRAMGTYAQKVTRYIALNEFCRRKFVEGGLPQERIAVKGNFVDFPPPPAGGKREGFLFVGRVAPEKGIAALADALRQTPDATLSVIGTGPEQEAFLGLNNAQLRGLQNADAVRQAMYDAACLVMPSIWYENFPRTLVEAFACGLPVIASRLGAMAELVRDGRTGLLFEAGNTADLAAKLRWAQDNPAAIRRMGDNARAEYEAKYTPEKNYQQLMVIYEEARAS
jgi:glycosyltransferase involved in cell wall biosynthesis